MDSKCLTITLVSTSADSSKRDLKLGPGEYRAVVGRSSKVESKRLHPAHDNGWFDNRVMSRSHAEFSAIPKFQEVYLMDTNSMHGTWVNGIRLTSGRKTLLEPNDVLTFGAVVSRGIESYDPVRVRLEITWKEEKSTIAATPYNPPHRQPNTFVVPEDDSDDSDSEDDEDVEIVDEMPVDKNVEGADEGHEEEVVDLEECGSESDDPENQADKDEESCREAGYNDDVASQSPSADAKSEDSMVASSIGDGPRDPSPPTSPPRRDGSDADFYGGGMFPPKDPLPWGLSDNGNAEDGHPVTDFTAAAGPKYPGLSGPLSPLLYQRGESSKNQNATSGENANAHSTEPAKKTYSPHDFPPLRCSHPKVLSWAPKPVKQQNERQSEASACPPPSKSQPAISPYHQYDSHSPDQKQGGYLRHSLGYDERDHCPSAQTDTIPKFQDGEAHSRTPFPWMSLQQPSYNPTPRPSSYMQGPFTMGYDYPLQPPPPPPKVSASPSSQADKIPPPTPPASAGFGPILSSHNISDVVEPAQSSHSCPGPFGGYSEDKYSPEPSDDRSEWLASRIDHMIGRMNTTKDADENNGYDKLGPLSVSRSDPRAIVQENGDNALKRKRDDVEAGIVVKPTEIFSREMTGPVSTSAELEEATEPLKSHVELTEQVQAPENAPKAAESSSNHIDEDEERPRKRMRTANHTGNARRFAATALAGAVVGSVGAVMALAALPAGFFD